MVTISKHKLEPFGGGGGGGSSRDLFGKRLKLWNAAAIGGTGGKSKAEEEEPLLSAMNMTENDRKRANFSALSNTNGAVIKMTTNTGTGKPGDIKKIVIKNFRGEILFWYDSVNLWGSERGAGVIGGNIVTSFIFFLFVGAIAIKFYRSRMRETTGAH